MTNKLTIIDKIRKLLALSESANENEAALAAEKAQELLARYNIDLFEVEDEKEEQPVEQGAAETRSQLWRRYIYSAIAKMYFCEYYFTSIKKPSPKGRRGFIRRDVHCLTGQPHNISVCKMVAAYLCATVILLANKGSSYYPRQEVARYKKSFHNACATRLQQRIKERLKRTEQTETVVSDGRNLPALASLYNQARFANRSYLEKLGVFVSVSKSSSRSSHSGGYKDGREAAKTIGLDTQIKGDSGKQLA